MSYKGEVLRRLYVFCAGMVLFGLPMLLSLPVETIAGTKLRLIETLTIPYGKGEGQLNTPLTIDIDKTRGEMYVSDHGGQRGGGRISGCRNLLLKVNLLECRPLRIRVP